MISLSEEIAIAAPPAAVWPLLRDPALVASCIPGAVLTAAGDEGAYQGTIQVRFGPTRAIFRGEAKLSYDDAQMRCTIEGRGIDGRGASRALASGVVTARGIGTTILACKGNFNVTGPLETFANAGGVHLARALLAEFAGNMARIVAERVPDVAGMTAAAEAAAAEAAAAQFQARSAAATTRPSAPELKGGRLLWRAFLGWLRQILPIKGKAR